MGEGGGEGASKVETKDLLMTAWSSGLLLVAAAAYANITTRWEGFAVCS